MEPEKSIYQPGIGELDSQRFVWTDDERKTIEMWINNMLSYLEKEVSEDNFQSLCNICYSLVSVIPITTIPIQPEAIRFILRSRPNFDGEIFSNEWEISYNSRNLENAKPGRFNRPKEGMFYGTLPSDDQTKFIAGATIESYKRLIKEDNVEEIQVFTFGMFHVKKEFIVANFCNHPLALTAHPGIKKIVEKQMRELAESYPKNTSEVIGRFWEVMSRLSIERSDTPQHHFITTAFFVAMREYYRNTFQQDVHGIMYPSSMVRGDSINIVLTPVATDTFLKLDEVFMYRYFRDSGLSKEYTAGSCSQICHCVEGKFEIQELLEGKRVYEAWELKDLGV